MEPISENSYQNGTLVRDAQGVTLLRLAAPDSVLLTHRSSTGPAGTLLVTRLGTDGKTGWATDTGIGRLEQVLPDERIIAFIATRPAVPNKVPEPILVMNQHQHRRNDHPFPLALILIQFRNDNRWLRR